MRTAGNINRAFFGEIPLRVARSLREEPTRWSHDGLRMSQVYELRHDSGLILWVANGTYGMRVENKNARWGGVTGLSSFGLSPGHHLLRRAADKWLRAFAADYRSPDLLAALDAPAARKFTAVQP